MLVYQGCVFHASRSYDTQLGGMIRSSYIARRECLGDIHQMPKGPDIELSTRLPSHCGCYELPKHSTGNRRSPIAQQYPAKNDSDRKRRNAMCRP
jgi:hypothetical protein